MLFPPVDGRPGWNICQSKSKAREGRNGGKNAKLREQKVSFAHLI